MITLLFRGSNFVQAGISQAFRLSVSEVSSSSGVKKHVAVSLDVLTCVPKCQGLTAVLQKIVSPPKNLNWEEDVRNRCPEGTSPLVMHWFIYILLFPHTHPLYIQC